MTNGPREATHSPPDLATLRAVNAACERFEAAWRQGLQPRIEDAIASAAEADRVFLLGELVALEVELKREQGERPAPSHYSVRFPEYASALALAWSGEAETEPAADEGPDATIVFPSAPPAPVELAEPSKFDKYEILGVLGRGGMGIVYKAWQKDLKRLVAIKMIHAVHIDSPEMARRFEEEARCAGGLQHPSIVRVHEAGQYQGRPYFAMEYLAGSGLDQVLKDGPVDPKEAARLVATIALAVGYLHEKRVIHRDLKPSNILMDGRGRPFVTDFGLMKLLEEDSNATSSGAVLGTPSHMAPEQAAGRLDRVGPLSDVYGLGAILYSLLTGRPPFHAPTQMETLVQVIEGEPIPAGRLRPGLPRTIEHICMRCLEKEPADRYGSANAVAEELEKFLRGDEIEWDQPGLWNRLRRWSRREPALVARLAAAGAAASASLVYHAFARDISIGKQAAIVGALAAWAGASAGFQALVNRTSRPEPIRMAWLSVDVLLLTLTLILSKAFGGPLAVAYPVLVVGSGLWFRVRYVVLTTALSMTVYIALMITKFLGPGGLENPHWHVVFLAAVAVLGLMVCYQVQRVRALSRYYENRPEVH
jgi:eukaryotic-like serine/threonine-protein kinase